MMFIVIFLQYRKPITTERYHTGLLDLPCQRWVACGEYTVNSLISDHPWCTRNWSLMRGGRLWEQSKK